MEKIKESVSAILTHENQVFVIKRPAHLKVFPGYFATPGGKVDVEDLVDRGLPAIFSKVEFRHANAVIREMKEELDLDLVHEFEKGNVNSFSFYGEAITPEFNPYRFKNTYLRIDFKKKPELKCDPAEIEVGEWGSPLDLLEKFYEGDMLAVPPAIKILNALHEAGNFLGPIDFNHNRFPSDEVPMIESLKDIIQFLPLSNTFPPANRTNSFLIGEKVKYLIDPSPKEEELDKYIKTISRYQFDRIFITHHHPDHYEFADVIARDFKIPMEMSEKTYKRILRKKGDHFFHDIEVTFRKEGEVITDYIGSPVRVYEVPGHDDGQLALAPDSKKWFLVGDLIQTIGTVVIGDDEGNMGDYFKSLKRVIAFNPQVVIPSHGIIIGGVNRLEETLKHRQMREDEILYLHQKGLDFDQILNTVYQGLDEKLLPYAKKTLICHLNKLREDGKVVE